MSKGHGGTGRGSSKGRASASSRRPLRARDVPFAAIFQGQSYRPEEVPVGRITEIGGLKQASYLREGMRPESFSSVRAADPGKLPPVSVDIYADGLVALRDGRHRLAVAAERGKTKIDAHVSLRNKRGNVVATRRMMVPISLAKRVPK